MDLDYLWWAGELDAAFGEDRVECVNSSVTLLGHIRGKVDVRSALPFSSWDWLCGQFGP
jgi:hypothetical protein